MKWSEYFDYDAESGDLRWKDRPISHFDSEKAMRVANSRSGKIAGGKRFKSNGKPRGIYIQLHKNIAAARIIWEMHYGHLPQGMVVDHVDRNPMNNRLDNLRPATNKQNSRNSAKLRNSTLPRGVYKSNKKKTWDARIMVDGKNLWIGTFACPEKAHEAYVNASIKYHGEFSIYTKALNDQ